jgi:DNA repair exonuclease SbcCD nuclease subunit
MIFGNHDYYTPNRFWFDFPENTHLFEKEAVETLIFKSENGETVSISGFSFRSPALSKNMLSEFPAKSFETDYHIGLFHGDSNPNSTYAPFNLVDMKAKNYDYFALGHIHVPSVESETPAIVYAGTPQGHTKKETDVKGVVLVELKPTGVSFEWISVEELEYKEKTISLSQNQTMMAARENLLQSMTEPAFYIVTLKDFEQLGGEFKRSFLSGELAEYLADRVNAIEVKLDNEIPVEKLPLTLNESTFDEMLDEISTDAVWNDLLTNQTAVSIYEADTELNVKKRVKEELLEKFELVGENVEDSNS